LVTILNHVKPNGQVPLRYGAYTFLFKFLGIPTQNKPRYREDKGFSTPTDNNSLCIIAIEKYCSKTQDYSLLHHHSKTIRAIINWNIKQSHEHLIRETKYAGWADSLKKTGWVLYTNILHLQALKSYHILCTFHPKLEEQTLNIQQTIKNVDRQINNIFWKNNYYIDAIDPPSSMTQFSTDGNILAILFDIASKEKSKKILNHIMTHNLIQNGCIQSCHPSYPKQVIYTPFHIINLSDYHNGLYWLWLSCLTIAALAKLNQKETCIQTLIDLCHTINSHNGIFEVYEQSFEPVNRLFYSSEKDFSWSSGLFIWMIHQVKDLLDFNIESSI
jgi:glycogen debranching enzyme